MYNIIHTHTHTHTHHAHNSVFSAMIFFSIFFLLLANAVSATPQTISVQGKLTDTLNNPYTGSKNFAFRIYSAQSGGSALYTEFWNTSSQQVSLAYGGYFSVLLGSQTALALPFDQQYWLEITVEGETLSPRYRLGSTPYTYHANITDNLAANANASGTLNMNSQSITNAAWLNATNLNVSANGYFGGNVGVGTTNPLSLLHLYQSGSNTFLNASNGTVNAGLFVGTLSGGNAGASIGTNSNHQFRLFTGGTDRLTVDTNGNVGIGTTGPSSLLELNNSAGDTGFTMTNGAAGTSNVDSLTFRANSSAQGSTGWIRQAGGYASAAAEGPLGMSLWNVYNAPIIFSTSNAEKMRITGTGNVGIGTAAPRSLLHTYGGGHVYIEGFIGGGGTAFTSTDTIPAGSNIGLIGYNGLALIPNAWGNAITIDRHNSLYIAGAQRNLNSVSAALGFGNWGYFTNTGTGAGGLGNATVQADAVKFKFYLIDLAGEFTQRLDLYSRSASGADTNAISVLSNGNVGVGTTNPSGTFHAAGTIYFTNEGTTASAANVYTDPTTGQVFRSTSSARYKDNIRNLEVDSSLIYKLVPRTFESKSDGKTYFGLVAEEVNQYIPQLVQYDSQGRPDSVAYPMLSTLMLPEMKKMSDAVQEQQAQIEQLKAENELLKSRVAALERGLSAKSQFW